MAAKPRPAPAHRLKAAGSAFVLSPHSGTYYATYGQDDEIGPGQCTCGELSPVLGSNKARREWFSTTHRAVVGPEEKTPVKAPTAKPCEWPWKQAHPTRAAANGHLYSLVKRAGATFLRPYPCPAGHWHVGHPSHRRRKP